MSGVRGLCHTIFCKDECPCWQPQDRSVLALCSATDVRAGDVELSCVLVADHKGPHVGDYSGEGDHFTWERTP